MIIIIIIDYWLLLIIIINIIIIIYMLHNAFFHDIPGEYFQIFGVAMPYPTYPTVWPRRYLLPAFEALRKPGSEEISAAGSPIITSRSSDFS
jgi:hypothetical protein